MKYFILILLIFLNGCLYVNERGVSTYLYDKCDEYYDANGRYYRDCEDTLSQSAIKIVGSISSSVVGGTKSLVGLGDSSQEKVTVPNDRNKKIVKKRKCKIVCKKKIKCKCKKKKKCAEKN